MKQIHPNVVSNGTAKRLLALERKLRTLMLDPFLDSESHWAYEFRSRRSALAARRGLLISSAVRFIEDLHRNLDLCLARFIVWRETRRRRKAERRQ
jgi:hypothetical protein